MRTENEFRNDGRTITINDPQNVGSGTTMSLTGFEFLNYEEHAPKGQNETSTQVKNRINGLPYLMWLMKEKIEANIYSKTEIDNMLKSAGFEYIEGTIQTQGGTVIQGTSTSDDRFDKKKIIVKINRDLTGSTAQLALTYGNGTTYTSNLILYGGNLSGKTIPANSLIYLIYSWDGTSQSSGTWIGNVDSWVHIETKDDNTEYYMSFNRTGGVIDGICSSDDITVNPSTGEIISNNLEVTNNSDSKTLVNKEYVDNIISRYSPDDVNVNQKKLANNDSNEYPLLLGGAAANTTKYNNNGTSQGSNVVIGLKSNKDGDLIVPGDIESKSVAVTNNITINGSVTQNTDAATKKYVDDSITNVTTSLTNTLVTETSNNIAQIRLTEGGTNTNKGTTKFVGAGSVSITQSTGTITINGINNKVTQNDTNGESSTEYNILLKNTANPGQYGPDVVQSSPNVKATGDGKLTANQLIVRNTFNIKWGEIS